MKKEPISMRFCTILFLTRKSKMFKKRMEKDSSIISRKQFSKIITLTPILNKIKLIAMTSGLNFGTTTIFKRKTHSKKNQTIKLTTKTVLNQLLKITRWKQLFHQKEKKPKNSNNFLLQRISRQIYHSKSLVKKSLNLKRSLHSHRRKKIFLLPNSRKNKVLLGD